jgi:hypothetical protein
MCVQVVELVAGGARLPVTKANRLQYVALVADWYLNGGTRGAAASAFAQGLGQASARLDTRSTACEFPSNVYSYVSFQNRNLFSISFFMSVHHYVYAVILAPPGLFIRLPWTLGGFTCALRQRIICGFAYSQSLLRAIFQPLSTSFKVGSVFVRVFSGVARKFFFSKTVDDATLSIFSYDFNCLNSPSFDYILPLFFRHPSSPQVIPLSWLSLFSPKELNEVIGGGTAGELDLDDMR